MRHALAAAATASALCGGQAAAQPFDGTVFMSPNVITAADPTSLTDIRYVGRGERVIYDRRHDSWVTVNAYLFQVHYERASRTPAPGQTAGRIEFQVNPEFGSPEVAQPEVETFAAALGRLPLVVVARLAHIHVNDGDELFGAGVSGGAHSITIHTVYGRRMLRDGFLEEVLFHEGAHSLDDQHADAAGWLAAQEADGAFISTYARDNPNREDIAESLLPYFAVRVVPGRLRSGDRDAIEATIPNRLAYFEAPSGSTGRRTAPPWCPPCRAPASSGSQHCSSRQVSTEGENDEWLPGDQATRRRHPSSLPSRSVSSPTSSSGTDASPSAIW